MKKEIALILILLGSSTLFSQNEVDSTTIDFNNIKVKDFLGMDYTPQALDFDFRVVDSLFFRDNSVKSELTSLEGDKQNFELKTENSKTILFQCQKSIPEKCITYLGYSDRVEAHLFTRCDEVCVRILMDAKNGEAVFLPGVFDSGSFPVFTSNYMIVWGATDEYGKQYYDGIQSYVEVYETLSSDRPLRERFKYIGHFESKDWSIDELYPTDQQDKFLMKITKSQKEFDYIEVKLNLPNH